MITTSRNQFIAAHVTREVKEAAKNEAVIQGKSLSLLIYEILEAELRKRGYAMPEAA